MTEQQIEDGYQRMDGALAPPPDTLARVERRVGTRRRRRRTAVAGGCALGLLAIGAVGISALGGDDPVTPDVATDTTLAPLGDLTLTRADGSTHVFDDIRVSCAPVRTPRNHEEEIEQTLRIRAITPRESADGEPIVPTFVFAGVLDKIQGDQTFTHPWGEIRSLAELPMMIGLHDGGLDLRGAPGDATGTVRVVSASCDPVPELHLEVDLTLAGKDGRPPVDLTGTLP